MREINPRWERLANMEFAGGFPDAVQEQELLDELYFQRAVQVYLGALPVVNMLAIRDGSEAVFGSGYNVLPIWKSRMDHRAVIPTPNADVVYAQSYLDLKKDGPLAISAPPRIIGMLTDFWQRPLSDVGVGGPDKGTGGMYLVLPPDFDGPVPDGYYVLKSPTYNVFLFWRAPMRPGPDGVDPAPGVADIEQTLVYPLRSGIPAQWKKMQFPDASGKSLQMMYPRDDTFFDMLNDFIQYEPTGATDAYLLGQLASIGIVKGREFAPDETERKILALAAKTAANMASPMTWNPDYVPSRLYYPGQRQWLSGYADADEHFYSNEYLNIDVRSSFFILAYSSASYMNLNRPGMGARYPSTVRDANGDYVSGEHTYKLHLPAGIPSGLMWALTLYSPDDGRMIDNGQPFPSINSMSPEVVVGDDTSVDLYFGPQLPDGVAEANWIRTNPGEGYVVMLRLYGATQPFYDLSWIPDDVVKLS